MSDVSISSQQTAETNLGSMVGIDINTLNGNVKVEKISQVQIVTFNFEGRRKSEVIPVGASPYLSLYPYTASNAPLFRGRDKDIQSIIDILGTQQILVVHGHTGVGKTSLLAAGVMPKLARAGIFPIQIQDYKEPAKLIFEALSVEASNFTFQVPKEDRLPIFLRQLQKELKGTILLVLDQFELLFDTSIPEEQRNSFIDDLAEAISTIDENLLRIIVSVRGYALERLGQIEKKINKLLQCSFQLQPLSRDQANSAIEDPDRVFYESGLIKGQILPDLDELSEEDPGFIHPQHLQLVCDELYRKSRQRGDVRIISADLWKELKGAEGIMASFMTGMIKAHVSENQQATAFQLLAVMASPGAERWMKPSEFDLKHARENEIEAILDDLVKAKLLIQIEGHGKTYSLVSQLITREFRHLGGTGDDIDKLYKAEDELERVWRAWLGIESFASREQLRYLTAFGEHLRPRAVKTLLMLRSAVEEGEETGTWVKRLRGDHQTDKKTDDSEGKQLIEQIENNEHKAGEQRIGSAMLVNAKRLLGFTEKELSDQTEKPAKAKGQENSSFGAVAGKAVSADSSAVRQTCALALSVVDAEFAVRHVEAALRDVKPPGRRFFRPNRRAELLGSLADADPEIAQLNSKLRWRQRIPIWIWRACRRISREGRRLAWLTLCGAVGAGLGVGLLRAILAIESIMPAGQELGIYFFFAGSLGAAVCYGTALSIPLRLIHSKSWQARLIGIVFGTVLFGLVHLTLATLNGVRFDIGGHYVILMGFVMGLGLSMSLSLQMPAEGDRLSKTSAWILSLLIASATFVLVSEFFILVRESTRNAVLQTQITHGHDHWMNVLTEPDSEAWYLPLIKRYARNPRILADLHSALTAVVMVTGLTLAMKWAKKTLQRRRN